MNRFVALLAELDESADEAKARALAAYYAEVPAADAAWATYLLCGRTVKRIATLPTLREWATEAAGLPDWLTVCCQEAVNDWHETLALILPAVDFPHGCSLADCLERRILPLHDLDAQDRRAAVRETWNLLDSASRTLFNKLLTGSLRLGTKRSFVAPAVELWCGAPRPLIEYRLRHDWTPTADFVAELIARPTPSEAASQPFPFSPAFTLRCDDRRTFGVPGDWRAVWTFGGVRAQLVRRDGRAFLWSEAGDYLSDRFAEIAAATSGLPNGTVLEGEWPNEAVAAKKSDDLRSDSESAQRVASEVFRVHDILEDAGQDVRAESFDARRRRLETTLAKLSDARIRTAPLVASEAVDDLGRRIAELRASGVRGVRLWSRAAAYDAGSWIKPADPLSILVVLTAYRRIHEKNGGAALEFTFAVRDGGSLTTVAKAAATSLDEERQTVEAFLRASSLAKFGPVRTVKPELVFELAFDDVRRTARRKSGFELRLPRVIRYRPDKSVADVDRLELLDGLTAPHGIGDKSVEPGSS
jgi:DNA ligase-1